MEPWGTLLANVAIAVGILVIMPLGLRLIRGVSWVWWVGAIPGAASLLLPRGGFAAALALVYFVSTLVLAATWARPRRLAPAELAILTALVSPAIAASSLVAERAGYPWMGFDLDTLTLTVAHFHYAGFAAALVAGLVSRAGGSGVAALCVPAGTVLVAIGHFTAEWVELAGALMLTVGMWLVAWVTWQQIRPAAPDRLTRLLFGLSAVVLFGTMLLAISWALSEVVLGLPHLSLSWMVATHGLTNAFGFALCAILAWLRFRDEPVARRRWRRG